MLVDIGVDVLTKALWDNVELKSDLSDGVVDVIRTCSAIKLVDGVYIIPSAIRNIESSSGCSFDLGWIRDSDIDTFGYCHSIKDLFKKCTFLSSPTEHYYITLSPRLTTKHNVHYVDLVRFAGTDTTPRPIHWFFEIYKLVLENKLYASRH